MSYLAKNATFLGFLRFALPCLRTPQLIGNLAFKTTSVEDTHLTLASIPFQVGVNDSLIILPLQTDEKKFDDFRISNSLVCCNRP